MKILVTRKLLDSDIDYIKNGLDESIPGLYEFVFPAEYTEESLLDCCEDVDVFLGPFVTRRLLEKAKQFIGYLKNDKAKPVVVKAYAKIRNSISIILREARKLLRKLKQSA